MKKHGYFALDESLRWNAYRQVINGENLVIDKVEVGDRVGLTADEIQKLSSGADLFLQRFLPKSRHSPNRYVLIADELDEKFTDQADEDYRAMKEELARVVDIVSSYGGRVLQGLEDVKLFAVEIDEKLPPLEDTKKAS